MKRLYHFCPGLLIFFISSVPLIGLHRKHGGLARHVLILYFWKSRYLNYFCNYFTIYWLISIFDIILMWTHVFSVQEAPEENDGLTLAVFVSRPTH